MYFFVPFNLNAVSMIKRKKMTHEEVNRELLEKYLKGECLPSEERLVKLYLQTPQSEKLLAEILSTNEIYDRALFEQGNKQHSKSQFWLESINQRIAVGQQRTRKTHYLFPFRNVAIWAGLIMMGAGVYALSYFVPSQKDALVFIERINPDGQRSIITLSDSSIVYLGPGSRLQYPERFAGDKREITLSGEAFFEVKKNPHKPFTVSTAQVRTTVLGTSFKIEAFNRKPLSVQVATGKVRVGQVSAHGIRSLAILFPGQRVTCFNGKVNKESIDIQDIMGLKESRLVFRNATLTEIAQTLQRWYNVHVSFKNQQKSQERMTLTIDAHLSVDKVLNVLSTAGKFNYNISNHEIIIH